MAESRTLRRAVTATDNKVKTEVKSTMSVTADLDSLVSDFLESVTVVHKAHLRVTGEGSYAAHKAMNEFYDEVGDLADDIAESYQGLSEKLLTLGPGEAPDLTTPKACISYLKGIYDKINAVQAECSHSEINNELDNVKTLINSTKYKLIFLR